MGERGKYIYGIINGGLPTARREEPYPEGIHAVAFKDIAAIVADAEIIDLANLSKEALAHFLLAHQRMIERLMGNDITIIPVRLGTFAVNEVEVLQILERGYDAIAKTFSRIDGKVEDDVVAMWTDPGVVLKEIAGEPDIRALREEVLAKKEGITVEDQMRVGFLVKKRFDERKKQYALEIVDALKEVSQNQKEHECLDDAMVMNEAFLISRCSLTGFMEKLEELGKRFDSLIRFRCVGPLPAYSFSTLEVRKVDCNEIDWARKRLCIGDFASREEIKKAYRSHAFVYHPDRNIDDRDSDADFQEVNRAYRILDQCCHDNLFSFRGQDDRRGEIIVQIRE
jgi:hypothetical protein